MTNVKIRSALAGAGLKQWELAKMLGITECKLSRKFRHELPEEEQTRIIAIIEGKICTEQLNDYQNEALRTVTTKHKDLVHLALGLTGEAGECAEIIKKFQYHGHELDKEHLAKELGDLAWYLAVMADTIGYDLGEIFWLNIGKRKRRYPDGFSAERSRNREVCENENT